MMRAIVTILALFFLSTVSTEFIIQSVRFKPGSSMLKGDRDGTVLVTLNTNEETSICNFNFDQVDAGIVCKTLGFPPKAYSLMTLSSTVTGPVLIGDFQCTGKEESLKNCLHSGRKVFGSKCGEHKRDVHVFCLEQKVEPPKPTVNTICTEKPTRLKITSPTDLKNAGFLQIYYNGAYHYVCDDKDELVSAFAEYYCKEICTDPVKPQLILPVAKTIPESLKYVVLNAGDPKFPVVEEKTTCRPSFVAGIYCGNENLPPEASPNVTCTTQLMRVTWNKDHNPVINKGLIKVLLGCIAENIISTTEFALQISFNLSKIENIKSEGDNIIYACNLMRQYVSAAKSEKSILVQCILPKKSNNSATIGFQTVTPRSVIGNFIVNSVIQLYTDNKFTNLLGVPYKIENDNYLYVKVSLLVPPSYVKLVLRKCYVANTTDSTTSNKENLIDAGCAQTPYDVLIYPLSREAEGFRFKPNGISTKFAAKQLYIVCEGLKCLSPSQGGCKYCGDARRKKRSIGDLSKYSDVPIAYHPISFV